MGTVNDDGPVQTYLDTVFDRLAGTGRSGRRTLAETEDHLLSAVEDATARGIDPHVAEAEAVARFGPPSASSPAGRGALTVATGWAVLGAVVALLGLTDATRIALGLVRFAMGSRPVSCGSPEAATANSCVTLEPGWLSFPISALAASLAIAVLGALMVVPLRMLRRSAGQSGALYALTGVALGVVLVFLNAGWGGVLENALVVATVLLLGGAAVLVARRADPVTAYR